MSEIDENAAMLQGNKQTMQEGSDSKSSSSMQLPQSEAIVPTCTFNGNPLLKRENVSVGLTEWHLNEIERCMKDPCYFAEHYMKVVHVDKGLIPLKLYDYQKRMLKAMDEHRYSIILSCRQSGKCVTGSAKVKVSHPKINDGQPFETTVEEVERLARKLTRI